MDWRLLKDLNAVSFCMRVTLKLKSVIPGITKLRVIQIHFNLFKCTVC